jgi:pyruvate dehydrogenase (quinone)
MGIARKPTPTTLAMNNGPAASPASGRSAAWRIDDPEEVGGALDALIAHDGPALLDAVVDADEPMLPPKRRSEYVEKLERALSRGTPHRQDIERALAEQPALISLKP